MVVNRAAITIAYHGPAIDVGDMDLEDLASSLLALGKILNGVNSVLNADKASLRTRIVSTGQGSLQVDLQIVQPIIDAVAEFIASKAGKKTAVVTAVSILAIVFGRHGVVATLKLLRGRSPDDGSILIEDKDLKLEIHGNVKRILRDPGIRRLIPRFYSPLKREGCEAISSTSPELDIDSHVTSKEARECRMLDAMPYEEFVSSEYVDLSVVTASDEGYRWRLSAGRGKTIPVSVSDDKFLADMREQGHFVIGARIQGVLDCYLAPPHGYMVYDMPKVMRHYKPEDGIRHRDMMLIIDRSRHTGEYFAVGDNEDERFDVIRLDGGRYRLVRDTPKGALLIAIIAVCGENCYTVEAAHGVEMVGIDDTETYDEIESSIAAAIFAVEKARRKCER